MEKGFNNIIKEIRKCNICEDKFGFKPHPVVIGSATSKIVQISQAPSKTVDTTLKPFTVRVVQKYLSGYKKETTL